MNNYVYADDFSELLARKTVPKSFEITLDLPSIPIPGENDRIFLWHYRKPPADAKVVESVIIGYGACIAVNGKSRPQTMRVKLQEKNLKLQTKYQQKVGAKSVNGDPGLKHSALSNYPSATPSLIPLNWTQANRLQTLVHSVGVKWTEAESIAGLWAYSKVYGDNPPENKQEFYRSMALKIGKGVKAVERKIANFQSLDSSSSQRGYDHSSDLDAQIRKRYLNEYNGRIDYYRLMEDYNALWNAGTPHSGMELPDTLRETPAPNSFYAPRSLPKSEFKEVTTTRRDRRHQSKFREELLRIYNDKCAISGHGPVEVLEAAHISGLSNSGDNNYSNGLILRADIHRLFDKNLITIDPSQKVCIDTQLKDTPYMQFDGHKIHYDSQDQPEFLWYLGARFEQTLS